MNAVKDKVWFLREGLFAKYVISLVGLVVFVLAVNGAMETWISYRETRASLTDAMAEKAEATARRIEQSIAELERQISWVTRASADTLDKRRDAYSQLLNQVPAVSQLTYVDGDGREQLQLSRSSISYGNNADYSRELASPKPPPAASPSRRPISAASIRSCRSRCRIPASMPASPSPRSTCISSTIFSATPRSARSRPPMWSTPRAGCWPARPKGPEVGKESPTLPQVAALLANGAQPGVRHRHRRALRC